MAVYGYHRVSTREQHLERGIQEIKQYCAEHKLPLTNIFTDQQTGKNFDRPRYLVLTQDVLRAKDTLIITELDRLGRNKADTMRQIQMLRDKGIRIMVLELPTTLIDITAMDNKMAAMMMETINNLMLELYASMAQAEIEKKEKRQREGIEQMKRRGEWDRYGRPRKATADDFGDVYEMVLNKKIRPVDAMRKLEISKATYYRYAKEYAAKKVKIY
ncbi:MAG: recombinase family protein [Eubacteriales bacterium]|nr:recombinase family protein [Eubacteriales bacterium]